MDPRVLETVTIYRDIDHMPSQSLSSAVGPRHRLDTFLCEELAHAESRRNCIRARLHELDMTGCRSESRSSRADSRRMIRVDGWLSNGAVEELVRSLPRRRARSASSWTTCAERMPMAWRFSTASRRSGVALDGLSPYLQLLLGSRLARRDPRDIGTPLSELATHGGSMKTVRHYRGPGAGGSRRHAGARLRPGYGGAGASQRADGRRSGPGRRAEEEAEHPDHLG